MNHSPQQQAVLDLLDTEGPLPATKVAEALGVRTSTATMRLYRAEGRGLVRRQFYTGPPLGRRQIAYEWLAA